MSKESRDFDLGYFTRTCLFGKGAQREIFCDGERFS